MRATAASALPSRSVPSVKRRKSPAASGSSGYAVGNSRASTGSSGSSVGPVKSSRASSGSSAWMGTARSLRSSSTSWDASERSRSASKPEKFAITSRLFRCRVKPCHCFSIVAQSPYSCMACTSRSISSRLPWLTTDLPSLWTSSISFSAFFLS